MENDEHVFLLYLLAPLARLTSSPSFFPAGNTSASCYSEITFQTALFGQYEPEQTAAIGRLEDENAHKFEQSLRHGKQYYLFDMFRFFWPTCMTFHKVQ